MLLPALIVLLLIGNIPPLFAETGGALVIARVLYRGPVPPPQEVEVTRDPDVCGPVMPVQPIVVQAATGGVKDAVVTVEGLSEQREDTPPPPVVLSNRRCAFTPHVAIVRVGALLEIHNQDPVMHNTHVRNEQRTFLNVAMLAEGRPVTKRVATPGLYRVQCDAHKFMQGYVAAADHPYITVSDETGHGHLSRIPAGRHEITVWHETLGLLRKEVTVPSSGEITVTFEYQSEIASPGKRTQR